MRKSLIALGLGVLMVVTAACGSGSESSSEDRNAALPVGYLFKQGADVSAGQTHTCAVTTAGKVECWGADDKGQLGGNLGANSTPREVTGLPTDVKAIKLSQGSFAGHVCAVLENASMWCWGNNNKLQVSRSSTTAKLLPELVTGNVVDVAAAENSTCLLKNTGKVQCFGAGDDGQRGLTQQEIGRPLTEPISYSSLNSRTLPLEDVVDVEAGRSFYCALMRDQTVDCWGNNLYGQVGRPTVQSSVESPTQIANLNGVVDIALGGQHACAALSNRQVWCWGNGISGQLAGGRTSSSYTPVRVVFGNTAAEFDVTVRSIIAGGDMTCVIDEYAVTRCWGTNDPSLWGENAGNAPRLPTTVSATNESMIASMGRRHLCTNTTKGLVRCHGSNAFGQVGDGKDTFVTVWSHQGVNGYAASDMVVTVPWFGSGLFDFGLLDGSQPGSAQPALGNAGAAGAGDPAQNPVANDPAVAAPATPSDSTVAGGSTASSDATSAAATAAKVIRLKVGRSATPKTLARWANLATPKGSKVTFSVLTKSRKNCARSGTRVKAVKAGSCTVKVKVAKKGAKARTKSIKVTIVK